MIFRRIGIFVILLQAGMCPFSFHFFIDIQQFVCLYDLSLFKKVLK